MNSKSKKQLIEAIAAEARKFFVEASGCHDWSHVERVRALARRIGREEKADLFVLEAAVLLHDIAKVEEMKAKGGFCHAEEGAKRAIPLLEKEGVDAETISRITHCIASHRNRSEGKSVPESLEAKILFDADKIDSLGAIGVARDFLFAGMIGVTKLYAENEAEHAKNPKKYEYTEDDTAILEYETHLKGIKDRMLTKAGRAIAKERSDFMKYFFTQFWKEVKGRA
jgi:uncharacterized protein